MYQSNYWVAYLVALGRLAAAAAAAADTSSLGAVAGDVSLLAALVAGLVVLHGLSAVTAWAKSVGEREEWLVKVVRAY